MNESDKDTASITEQLKVMREQLEQLKVMREELEKQGRNIENILFILDPPEDQIW